MDLNLWSQNDEEDNFDGVDKTDIFNTLELVDDINYNHVNRSAWEEPDPGEVPVPGAQKEREGVIRYKKPFHTTIQKKLAFLNQKHVMKHLHVEYPDDDDDEAPDDDPDDNGYFNMFGVNNESNDEVEQKNKTRKV